jgi:hypothetical protein
MTPCIISATKLAPTRTRDKLAIPFCRDAIAPTQTARKKRAFAYEQAIKSRPVRAVQPRRRLQISNIFLLTKYP